VTPVWLPWLVVVVACDVTAPEPVILQPDAFLPSTECRIENVLTRLVGAAQVRDCGHLAIGADEASLVAARDCVIAAESAHEPYVAEWQRQGTDSRLASAYVGLDTASGWTSYHLGYDGDPGGGGGDNHPATAIWACRALVDQGACAALSTTLCLACDAAMLGERCDSQLP
jgi:hypothetical protein